MIEAGPQEYGTSVAEGNALSPGDLRDGQPKHFQR
jgi:hypothetical protein